MLDHDHTHEDHGMAEVSRRTFLKLAGFAFAGTVAGCARTPVQHAVPALVPAEDVVPGRPTVYASTCGGCNAGCGLLVKTRDGRPIKLEGNPGHPLSLGGLCAAGQASILGLYDRQRLQHPSRAGTQATWSEIDAEIRNQLEDHRRQRRAVRLLSGTITSPTTRQAIASFLAGFPNARHVVWDPISHAAILDAHQQTHGIRALPRYEFDRAEVIVSFEADFLGTWIAPVAFAAAYQRGRYLEGLAPHLSYHVQFESAHTLTGTKADQRLCVGPGELGLVMTELAARVARKAGVNWGGGDVAGSSVPARFLDELANRLWNAKGRCLVVCGSDDLAQQLICNFLNHLLDSYRNTLDVVRPSYQSQSDDLAMQELVNEIRQGQVGALFLYRCNPLYDLPEAGALAEALRTVPLTVSFAPRMDETAVAAKYVCPEPHYLETWNDAEAVDGVVSLFQPALRPLGETRPLLESLATWMGAPRSAYDQLRAAWQANVFPRSLITVRFEDFWNQALLDGAVRVRSLTPARPYNASAVVAPIREAGRAGEALTMLLHRTVAIPDGGHAYNPWLQELPDPLTKITWDNYAAVSQATATRLGLSQGDVVRFEGIEGVQLPVVVQPGQHDQVVAVALGYGSRLSARFADIGPPWLEARPGVGDNGLVGSNAAPLLTWQDGRLRYRRDGIRLVKTGRQHPLACTQDQPTLRVPPPLAGRQPLPIIRETTLPALQRSATHAAPAEPREDLWPNDHPITGPRWGLAIDLTGCTGCSACVIACQVENNIPVVGKDEVRRHREMHWMRIDRYYSQPSQSPVDGGPRRETEVDVAHQPMLCQHCGNAPCEVVCPVLATVHSSDGLNQQVYNRCVGTRYCANNCPYKVRRFNWFDYAHDDHLENLVLNPDVTVRTRGVMEKCTLCVQRIQDARLEARRLGREMADGDIQTACQQSCPSRAIVFGDLNDAGSRAAQLARSSRAYHVLEELNVQSAVSYLSVVRNRPAAERRGEP